MIIKLDHIGITVASLAQANEALGGFHHLHHTQYNFPAPRCVNEVASGTQASLSIALHYHKPGFGVELIEYDQKHPSINSLFVWSLDANAVSEFPHNIATLDVEQNKHASAIKSVVSHKTQARPLNTIIILAEDLALESSFWQQLGFRIEVKDDQAWLLAITGKMLPFDKYYIALRKSTETVARNTDFLGLNEIAFLCSSCQTILERMPAAGFRTSISQLVINDKTINIGFLRSPSGVLVELFSLVL